MTDRAVPRQVDDEATFIGTSEEHRPEKAEPLHDTASVHCPSCGQVWEVGARPIWVTYNRLHGRIEVSFATTEIDHDCPLLPALEKSRKRVWRKEYEVGS